LENIASSNSLSAFRKGGQFRPEAVLIAEEIRRHGIEAILEHRFYRRGTFHCDIHGLFTDETPDATSSPCPKCKVGCAMSHFQADIFLPEHKICLEIKGKIHDSSSQERKDVRKEEYLEGLGLKVVSSRAEWFLDSKRKPRHEWIAMYSSGIAKLLEGSG
jgi:hypothetical protein